MVIFHVSPTALWHIYQPYTLLQVEFEYDSFEIDKSKFWGTDIFESRTHWVGNTTIIRNHNTIL